MNENKSFAALLKFMDYLRDKGLMNSSTVKARKASANKVLSVLEPDELQDVTNIDIDDAMLRFSNLEGQKYTPASLSVYKSRTKAAIEDFELYLSNPLGFRPTINSRSTKKKVTTNTKVEPTKPISSLTEQSQKSSPTQSQEYFAPNADLLPIRIRRDLTVRIHGLPFDLTEQEAKKIAAIIHAHSVPE